MNITIDFRHPWSVLDKVAHIQREDLKGKQARRVVSAARAELNKEVYSSLFASYTSWCELHKGNIDTWNKARKERARLEELCRRYEPRTYTVKELDDLTPAEWAEIVPWELDMLSDYERKKYGV